jgi:hypothetical protein
VYYFDSNKATYVGMDEEQDKAIKDFTFDSRVGIIKYTDQRGGKWTRKINSNPHIPAISN